MGLAVSLFLSVWGLALIGTPQAKTFAGRGWDNPEFVVGYHIGHSRLTAVARFRNDTTLNLGVVEGSLEYKQAMEAAIRDEAILPSYAVILAEHIDRLANLSQSLLGEPVQEFELAAPWLERRRYPLEGVDVLRQALRLTRGAAKGLPEIWHVNEAVAVNVANGRQHCRESSCVRGGHLGLFRRLCYLSLTDSALYSSSQSDSCLHLSWGAKSHIDTEVGLDKLAGQDAAEFWALLHQRLSGTVHDCVRGPCLPTTILASGEAVTNENVLSILEAVSHSAQVHCDEHPPAPYENDRGERQPKPTVQLLVSEDPIFAAASGAAFSMRRRYWDYCASVNKTKANNIYWDPDYDDGGYWNPVNTAARESCLPQPLPHHYILFLFPTQSHPLPREIAPNDEVNLDHQAEGEIQGGSEHHGCVGARGAVSAAASAQHHHHHHVVIEGAVSVGLATATQPRRRRADDAVLRSLLCLVGELHQGTVLCLKTAARVPAAAAAAAAVPTTAAVVSGNELRAQRPRQEEPLRPIASLSDRHADRD
ncbi:hypothetical protein PWT90_03745 [Aphanocladium album]|nr:hypothetical protein PWT90_03745 [Aphanocladium album]